MLDMIRMAQVEPVRKRLDTETQRLLGSTIRLTDEQWRAPSLLPGWSRGHVATHLARNADALGAATLAAEHDLPVQLYVSEDDKLRDLEAGAGRPGLELQIDLDTSAGKLVAAFDAVTDWHREARFPWGISAVAAVPVARLSEVLLHHVDLDCGFTPADIDPVPARWVLQWALLSERARRRRPPLRVESDSGLTFDLGTGDEEPRLVTGSDAALWSWVTGRSDDSSVSGSGGLVWPPS